MLRKLLLLLALLILVAIGLVWANVIDVNWNREASSPVEVRVNPVQVGTETREVQTPVVRVGNSAETANTQANSQ